MSVASGASLDLSGVTIAKGDAPGQGGGIYNDGTLTVTNSTFAGNTAPARLPAAAASTTTAPLPSPTPPSRGTPPTATVGAIHNNVGTLTVTNSTFSGNTATSYVRGRAAASPPTAGTLTVTNSTFSGNTAEL